MKKTKKFTLQQHRETGATLCDIYLTLGDLIESIGATYSGSTFGGKACSRLRRIKAEIKDVCSDMDAQMSNDIPEFREIEDWTSIYYNCKK